MEARIPDFLSEALEEAKKAAALDEVPVGAIVVDSSGKILGRGHNLRESSHDPTSHAEILAIREATQNIQGWRLENCTLIVTLEPCPMCLAACQQARIPTVYYGAKDPKGGALSLGYNLHEDTRTNHRFKVEYLEHEGSSKILTEFFKAKRASNKRP